jgi:uncharacterized membrane protein YciS (DUF1049 family)
MSWLSRLLWGCLALAAFFFAALAVNQSQVGLRFLVWETPQISVFWWLLLAFAVGLTIGLISVSLVSVRARLQHRSLSRKLVASEKEVQQLRNSSLHE